MADHVLVTGAAGVVGRRVARRLRGASTGAGLAVLVGAAVVTPLGEDRLALVSSWLVVLACGALLGVGVHAVVSGRDGHMPLAAASGGLLGVLGWIVVALSFGPLVLGRQPSWSLMASVENFSTLVAAVLHGTACGVVCHVLKARDVGQSRVVRGPGEDAAGTPLHRVVIVGGGFAGLAAARRLERWTLRRAPIDVTLVSRDNFLLFTPMLAEVASSAVQASHISAPIRTAVSRTRFRHGVVTGVDTERRLIDVAAPGALPQAVPYDHLILAVGSVPSIPDLPGVREQAFTLKTLDDAMRLRDHVIGLLERADGEDLHSTERARLLSIVVAGGGFAGTEIVAELFDLVHGVLPLFPSISADEPRFVLVHSRDVILPELPPGLGAFALRRLRARGIEFRLRTRVTSAAGSEVTLSDGEVLAARTLVWTAGNQPAPLVAGLGGDKNRSGAVVAGSDMRVDGLNRVWAVGDCAEIPDLDQGGTPCPPTAQHAQRQGAQVADNVMAAIQGREPAPFRFKAFGALVALGHRTAAADLRGRQFAGLFAWLMWRGVYLAKLPGIEKRLRVLLDWALDGVLPRDIVVTSAQSPAQTSAEAPAQAPWTPVLGPAERKAS